MGSLCKAGGCPLVREDTPVPEDWFLQPVRPTNNENGADVCTVTKETVETELHKGLWITLTDFVTREFNVNGSKTSGTALKTFNGVGQDTWLDVVMVAIVKPWQAEEIQVVH